MAERPNYVPRLLWLQGQFGRDFSRSPRRVFWWLVLMPVGWAVLAVWSLLDHDELLGVSALVVMIIGLVQTAVYAPRTLRAVRQEEGRG